MNNQIAQKLNMRATNKWLGVVVALQALILVSLWGMGSNSTTAKADGIPDAGAQREQMIEQQKATNEKLDKLVTLLTGGDLRVRLNKTDDNAANR